MTAAWRVGVLVAMMVATLTACTSVHPGTAVRDPREDPQAVTAVLLDPGPYPTTPGRPVGAAGSPEAGARLEALRLANSVVLGFQVDPALDDPRTYETGPVLNTVTMSSYVAGGILAALDGHNFISGWVNSTGTKVFSSRQLRNVVLRFAGPPDAAAAAAGMLAASNTVMTEDENHNPVPAVTAPAPIPGHPEAGAFMWDPGGWTELLSVTARGPFVLLQVVWADDPPAAGAMAAKTLDLQLPAIDQFVPTAPDQLAALPADPSGLLARTVTPPGQERPTYGTYGPEGALGFMSEPARTAELFSTTGMTIMANKVANVVYQVRDAAAAGAVVDDFSAEVTDQKFSRAQGVPGLPAARCFLSPKDKLNIAAQSAYCLLAVDRFVVEEGSTDLDDLHQMMSAQYLMLTAR
jgi:hypothetical protein